MVQNPDNAKRTLVLSDNVWLSTQIQQLLVNLPEYGSFEFAFSPQNKTAAELFNQTGIKAQALAVNDNIEYLIARFDVIISAHCKQLFPAKLVKSVRCINIHPGLNPHNRGWYPQVFSILNKLPLGATIHEIDEELDHGPIICQKEVPVYAWDTSLSAYERVQDAEMELLREWLPRIIAGDYQTYRPQTEGNLNLKKDFNALCELDLNRTQKIGDTLNLLRALTHGEYKNAYFVDENTGKKIFVALSFTEE